MTRFSNKGQTYADAAIIAVVLVVAAISFVLVTMIQKQIADEFLATDDFNSSTVGGRQLATMNDTFPATFDTVFLIVFVLFWLFIIVSSIFIDASPIFLVISLVLMALILIVVAVMSNAYEDFITSDGDLYTFSAAFPRTNYIMEHLVMFIMFIGLTGAIAIYGKNSIGAGP